MVSSATRPDKRPRKFLCLGGMPMTTKQPKPSKSTSRRKFLLAAGATGAAAWRCRRSRARRPSPGNSSRPGRPRTSSTRIAVDYAKKVNDMTGGRLKLDVLAAGAVVPAFQLSDAVHSGMLDGGHGVCAYWYGKHKAYSLFGTPPSFGWDANGMLAWFYAWRRRGALQGARQRRHQAQPHQLPLHADADPAAGLVQERDQERPTTSRA